MRSTKWANKKHKDNDGWFSRSIRDLAKDMSMSINGVIEAKRELIDADFLIEDNGKKTRNRNRYPLLP